MPACQGEQEKLSHPTEGVIALQLIVWDASGRPIWDASGHLSSLPGRTTDLTAVGLWEQVDERTGRTQSWFKITERGGVYEGTLVQVSSTCEGAGASFLGLTLIKGMRRNGNSYDNGTITDPRDGSLYSALMRLSPDRQKLEVRGYLAISLFGRSQIWNRLPDNALTERSQRAAPTQRRAAR
jgi:hypothetical protein